MTPNPGKAVVTSLGGASAEDMNWVNTNPIFWLVDVGYLWDIRTISAHETMVAINNAVSVDLTGQISAESIGYKIISASGGQTVFAITSFNTINAARIQLNQIPLSGQTLPTLHLNNGDLVLLESPQGFDTTRATAHMKF